MALIRLEDRCLFPYFFTIEDFIKKYVYTPKYDPNKPIKRWFDESLVGHESNNWAIKTYPAATRRPDGTYTYDPAGIMMPAEIAWWVNIPDGNTKPSTNIPFAEWPIPIKFDPSKELIKMVLGVPFIDDGLGENRPAAAQLNDHEMISAIYTKIVLNK